MRPAPAATVALALALATPATATAAEPREPVVGGGSFATAPVLETGRYRDTLLPAERLFYGVRLEPGQQLRVRAAMLGDDDEDYAYDSFAVGIETPAREVEVLDVVERDLAGNGTIIDGDRGDAIEFVTPTVETLSTGLDEFSGYAAPASGTCRSTCRRTTRSRAGGSSRSRWRSRCSASRSRTLRQIDAGPIADTFACPGG